MNLKNATSIAKLAIKRNSPAIMVSFGVSGVIITSYLSAKASFKAAEIIKENEDLETKEIIKKVAPVYIPTFLSGTATIGCVIMANKINSKRTAAAYSLMTISERAFDEYKEKVIEKLGERKEKAIQDEIAQDKVNKNPVNNIIVNGTGTVLCCELLTGRYFNSDMESLRKAQNDVNEKLIREMQVSLSDFYYAVNLDITSQSWDIGWEAGKNMSLDFTTVLASDGRPCLAFNYNYLTNL